MMIAENVENVKKNVGKGNPSKIPIRQRLYHSRGPTTDKEAIAPKSTVANQWVVWSYLGKHWDSQAATLLKSLPQHG